MEVGDQKYLILNGVLAATKSPAKVSFALCVSRRKFAHILFFINFWERNNTRAQAERGEVQNLAKPWQKSFES